MSNRTLCVLSKCTVCVFCTLSSVYVCKYVLSICKLFLHCLEHALKNFTHQGTCTGDVTIKVIWFDLCFIFNFLTSPPKHVLFSTIQDLWYLCLLTSLSTCKICSLFNLNKQMGTTNTSTCLHSSAMFNLSLKHLLISLRHVWPEV